MADIAIRTGPIGTAVGGILGNGSVAASIAAHGLLQNLSVVRADEPRYAVVAGSRRLAALRLLIKRGKLARDFAAPCTIIEPELSAEASLAENVQRAPLHPLDQHLVRDFRVHGAASPAT